MKKKGADKAKKQTPVEQLSEKPNGFLIVGIGASAGGIQALKEFFEYVPADSGMAYVVILHLSPDHDSKLAEVLQVVAAIPVTQVVERTEIKPDHVYVVPPAQHLVIEEGFIAPSANLNTEDRRAPVDIFFRNLADVHGPRAVCVVLSGTGANGSMGLKRIKERGGVAYVQNPREAEFNEMPRNSIATELVDEVLNVAEIPAHILAYRASLGSVQIIEEAESRPEDQQQALREIVTQLRVRTGHDFSNYKRPTLLRRIERRINVRNLPDLPAYTAYLQDHPDETHALLKDLLISVTNFFRDGKAFEGLEQDVLPAIFTGKTSEDQVRIWVAGCATGEEAYSIAMLCAERILGALDAPKVQIFATDIDEAAIATAREGLYTINDAADVSPERLRRFFNRDGDGYRVRREIREMILFAAHNFLKDPPFSKLDLISCRNVLIYLNGTAQERVIETFHFALKPKGFLFLGTSESVDGASDLYAVRNRDHHIYQSRETAARNYPVPESVPTFHFPKNTSLQKPEEGEGRSGRISFGDLHQKLLEQYAPPSVVINGEYEIVHMSERVGKYFEFAGGEPTQNLLKLVRPEIRLELRSALYQAVQNKTAVEARNLKLSVNGRTQSLDIHIRPVLQEGDTARGFILVIFNPAEEGSHEAATVMSAMDEPVAKQLEEELLHLKAQLRGSVEQHEYQAEELKASNEELQAMNEELRSAAEELETSKEELQSINEELRTVNQELKVKIDETSNTSNNLQNLINSANVGTIFLDRSFSIRLFTPAILDLFNLKASDHGRPITDITNKLQYDGLLQDAETVLEKLTVIEREVTTTDQRHFLMRLNPYRTSEDRINGVVITFYDITKRKQSENALQQSEERLRLLIESAKDYAIFTLDADRKVVSWSSGAQEILGYAEAEIIGKSGDLLFIPEDCKEGAPEKEAARAEKEGRAENERWHQRKDGSRFWGSGVTHPLHDGGGKGIGFVKIMRDLTLARRLEEAKFFLASIVETSNDSIITIDFQRNITSWNKAAEHLYGYTAQEAIGKNLTMLTLPEDFGAILAKVDAVAHSREVVVFDTVRHKKDGQPINLEIVMSPVLNAGGEVIGVSTIARDVSERKRREANPAFLANINLGFAPLLSIQEVMEPVASQLADYLHLNRCHFSLINEEADRVELIYEYRPDESLPSIKTVQHVSEKFTEEGRQQLGAGQLVVMNEVSDNSLVKGGAGWLKGLGFGSLVYVPHLEAGSWRFLLTAGRADQTEWRKDELELLQELAFELYIRIERARAEEALRKSEERLKTAQEAANIGIWNFDAATGQVYWSETMWKLYGYEHPPEKVEKGTWENSIYPEDRPRVMQGVAGFLASSQTDYRDEFRILTLHGEVRWVESIGKLVRDNSGQPVAMAGVNIDLTERKRAEEAVRNREEQLRTMAKNLPGGAVFIVDKELRFQLAEGEALIHAGIATEDLVGRPINETVIAKLIDGLEADYRKALAGETFEQEQHIDNRSYISRGVPLLNLEGEVYAVLAISYDITARKKAEEALSQSEARFRTLANVVPQVIWTNNAEGIADYFNQRWYDFTGLNYEQSKGPGWQAIVHPDDASVSVQKWKEALESGNVFETEYRLRRHNGSYCWFIGRNVPLKDASGEVAGWFGSATEIESLKKAQQTAAQSEEKLRITMESATDYAIITMDTERRIERWSSGATQIFGYTEKEVIGKSADIIFVEEDIAAGVPQHEMETARETGRAADERWHRRKDGSLFFMSGFLRPIYNEHLTGYVKVARDATQQKMFTEELSRLVAERTLELQQSNESLQQFATIAAHDLQEPLRKLRLFASVLQRFRAHLPGEGQELLQKIYASSERMSQLISEVLQYSKIAYGASEMVPTNLDVILQNVLNDLELRLEETGATVIYETPLPQVNAVPPQINQLFYNLLTNALKFRKEGRKPVIQIMFKMLSAEERKTYPHLPDNKAYIEIRFVDNGIGFDDQFSEQIFQIFERLHTVDEFEGTGVGLALCKKIMENHHGHIFATSGEGEGASFIILLPVSE